MAKTKATRPSGPRPGAQTGMIRARIDPALKGSAESILATLGLNPSDAIRMFYKQITLSDGLSFDIKIPNVSTRKAIRDARAGKDVTTYASVVEMIEKLGIGEFESPGDRSDPHNRSTDAGIPPRRRED